MNRQQSTVIWLGIVLITLNLIVNLTEIKSVLFGAKAASTPTAPASTPDGNATIPVQPSPTPNATPTANQVSVT